VIARRYVSTVNALFRCMRYVLLTANDPALRYYSTATRVTRASIERDMLGSVDRAEASPEFAAKCTALAGSVVKCGVKGGSHSESLKHIEQLFLEPPHTTGRCGSLLEVLSALENHVLVACFTKDVLIACDGSTYTKDTVCW